MKKKYLIPKLVHITMRGDIMSGSLLNAGEGEMPDATSAKERFFEEEEGSAVEGW